MNHQRLDSWLQRAALVAVLMLSVASAEASFRIADIRIEGLQRIAAGTVFNALPVQVDEVVSDNVTAAIIRALYGTGFFDDVTVEREGDVLIVVVRERPAVAEIEIVGNRSIKTDALKEGLKDIGLAEGRVFNRQVLDRIEQELRRQYYAAGRYGVDVRSTVSPLERNRVAVRIEVTEGLTSRLKQINIIGNEAFDDRTLLRQFTLGPTRWHSFYTRNDQYAREKLAADLENLRSFYLDRGFIEFDIVSTQVSISPTKHDIYITIVIDEGEVFHVSDIQLAGDPSLPTEQLFPLIHMRRGEIFSRKTASESAERISNLLADEGYAFANVNTIPEIDRDKQQVAVTFFVDPGRRVYVRRINMKGNTRTRDEVLRREMRQFESAWFSAEQVRRSRERLQRLGFFEDVTIETPAVPGAADLVDVDVTVKERPSGNLMAGIGYSQSDGILFNTSISQNNFLGTGKRVSFAFNSSRSDQLYRLAYTNPYYTVDGISRGFDLSYRTTDFDRYIGADYATDVGIAEVNFGLPITDTSRAGLGFRYQFTRFFAGDFSTLAQNFIQTQGDEFHDFFLTASYTRDSRDSALMPTQGARQRLFGEIALPGSDQEYYRINASAQQYVPLTGRFTFSMRGDVGYGAGYGSTKEMPFFENFYAGGPMSVRGWRAHSLGPREAASGRGSVGGNLKLGGSVELFAPPPIGGQLERTLRLGTFLDFGNVWWTENNPLVKSTGFDAGDFRYSAGLSLAWLSPVGAIAISLAHPLNPADDDRTQTFQFSLGQTF